MPAWPEIEPTILDLGSQSGTHDLSACMGVYYQLKIVQHLWEIFPDPNGPEAVVSAARGLYPLSVVVANCYDK